MRWRASHPDKRIERPLVADYKKGRMQVRHTVGFLAFAAIMLVRRVGIYQWKLRTIRF